MTFNIAIDFITFPSDLFRISNPNDPNDPGKIRQDTVKAAAATWANFIKDDFVETPVNTVFQVINPSTGLDFINVTPSPLVSTPSVSIQDLLIYVGSRPLSFRNNPDGSVDRVGAITNIAQQISQTNNIEDNGYNFARRNGLNFEPAVATIVFTEKVLGANDYSPSDPYFFTTSTPNINNPDTIHADLYATALHEIGHALGFFSNSRIPTLSNQTAFQSRTSYNSNSPAISFTGPNAGTVNLFDSFHLASTTPDQTYITGAGGQGVDLMTSSFPNGTRPEISELDLKILADIGYQINRSGITTIPLNALIPNPMSPTFGSVIAGTKGNDTITGGSGNDILAGGPGIDTINGLAGNDILAGGTGADIMSGGLDNDTYYVDNLGDEVIEELDQGFDTIVINSVKGDLSLYNKFLSLFNAGDRIEQIFDPNNKLDTLLGNSNKKNDLKSTVKQFPKDPNDSQDTDGWTLTSFEGDDDLKGFTGNDIIRAGAGNDKVFGGEGDDTLFGEAGNDLLVGGGGNDTLFSGAGFNTLVGFDIGATTGKPISTPNQVDRLVHSGTSRNIFVLSSGGVNAYTAGNDYARITGWIPNTFSANSDRLKVAIGTRAIAGLDPRTGQSAITIVDPSGKLIACLEGSIVSREPNGSFTDFPNGSFIIDQDVSIFPLVETIGENNPSGSAFRIQRATAPTADLAINYIVNTSSDQATLGTDYNANFTGTATILAGTTYIDLPFTLIQNQTAEANKTISLSLTPSGNYAIGILSDATITIIDNQVNLSVNTTTASETDRTLITLTATNSNPVIGDQNIPISYTGVGINANDFSLPIPIQILIPDGQTSGSVTFTVNDDTLVEGDELVTFTLSNPTAGLTLGAITSQTVSILDNDFISNNNLSVLEFSSASYSVKEDGSTNNAIRVTRTGNITGTVGITINLADGTATAPADYNSTPISISFADGETSKVVVVPIVLDSINEATETVNLTLSNATGSAVIGNLNTALLSIENFVVPSSSAKFTKSDFNNDGKSDIFWRDPLVGTNAIWNINGTNISNSAPITAAPANFSVQKTGDFNGDGKADIFWRDPLTGTNAIWLMDNFGIATASFTTSAPSNFTLEAVGDFFGTGKSSLLWRDRTSGSTIMWQMDGTSLVSGTQIVSPASNWTVAGTGDFNGDGKTDILWRDPLTGTNAIWNMNGTSILSSALITSVPSNFSVQKTGDFNGDGKADIFWRDPLTGTNGIWLMDNFGIATASFTTSAPSNFTLEDAADYYGTGKSGLLWRDRTTGFTAMWQMDGTNLVSGAQIVSPTPNFQVTGLA